MYVYVCVCMYVCVCVSVCVGGCARVHTSVCVCVLLRSHTSAILFLVDKFSEVSDSVCVGQPVNGDERVVLFVKMVKGKRYVAVTIIVIPILGYTLFAFT